MFLASRKEKVELNIALPPQHNKGLFCVLVLIIPMGHTHMETIKR